MKKVIASLLSVLLIIALISCGKNTDDAGLVLTGEINTAFAINHGYFTIETTDGSWFGFEITNETTIDYGEQTERLAQGYIVDVVCGYELKEIADIYRDYSNIEKWYCAESITVTDYCPPITEQGYAKPVIYLYPEKETNVTVTLDCAGDLTCTYPKSDGTWSVTAQPDGTLTDAEGQEYNYLYWEGESDVEFDFSKGFCVKGEDTAEFLETALADLGLTRREANEFIVYWLPLMEVNEYNVIAFQTDIYEKNAKLTVEPTPDTVIRVFMAWYGVDEEVTIEPQVLTAPERTGFTVIEWGGSQLK